MNENAKLKVVLLALTGFGNTVLRALVEDSRVNVPAVFTIKYDAPFPYYAEKQLLDLCSEAGIVCNHSVNLNSDEGISLLEDYSPDLIIVATFKQILRKNVLQLPSLGVINFHPSLLPKYRGPCPTNAALLNNEKVAGVTVHYVTEGLDEGNILLQKSITIDEIENDGSLRQRLALLSGKMVPEVIGMFAHFTKPVGVSQEHSQATYAPKPTVEDGYLDSASSISMIRNMMRAFNPLPGTSYLVGSKRIAVEKYELFRTNQADGVSDQRNAIEVVIHSQGIRLYKKN